jgi:hypothetical protein
MAQLKQQYVNWMSERIEQVAQLKRPLIGAVVKLSDGHLTVKPYLTYRYNVIREHMLVIIVNALCEL